MCAGNWSSRLPSFPLEITSVKSLRGKSEKAGAALDYRIAPAITATLLVDDAQTGLCRSYRHVCAGFISSAGLLAQPDFGGRDEESSELPGCSQSRSVR
jgi:hypothetical protein